MNGVFQRSIPMRSIEKSRSVQGGGGGRNRQRTILPINGHGEHSAVYGRTSSKRHRHHPVSSSTQRRNRGEELGNDSVTTRHLRRTYHAQMHVPEPDYSQSENDDAESSLRTRNHNYWANSSEYYQRTNTDGPDRDHRSFKRGLLVNADSHGDLTTESNMTTRSLRSRPTGYSPQWPPTTADAGTSPRYSPDKRKQTLPIGKSGDSHPHVTTITLTDQQEINGNVFPSSLNRRENHTKESSGRLNNQTAGDGLKSSMGRGGVASAQLESALPAAFSNVNLLKRVNDRYKLTERLLIQLKIIAVLHIFFGVSMFSLDLSQAIVLSPYTEDTSERLYLWIRGIYSLGVILIGGLSIVISCGKRSILMEIVKVVCVIFLTTLLATPAQTPFFQSIADSLRYKEALRRRHSLITIAPEGQLRHPATPQAITGGSHWSKTDLSNNRRNERENTFSDRPSPSEGQMGEEIDRSNSVGSNIRSVDDTQAREFEQQRQKALRIAQHLRIAYAIFACCHFILTVATLITVVRLERIS